MKTARMLRRLILGTTLLAGALLLTGCVTLSVNPLYDEATLIYEPGLIGVWGDPEGGDGDTWEFQPAGENTYRLLEWDAEGNSVSEKVFRKQTSFSPAKL